MSPCFGSFFKLGELCRPVVDINTSRKTPKQPFCLESLFAWKSFQMHKETGYLGRMSSISTRGLSEFTISAFCEENIDPDSITEDSQFGSKVSLGKNIQTQLYKAEVINHVTDWVLWDSGCFTTNILFFSLVWPV